MKKLLSLFVLTLLVSACNFRGGTNETKPVENAMPVLGNEDAEEMIVEDEASSSSGAKEEASVRVISVTASNWEFSPSTITAKKGERVTIRISGDEGIHSFLSEELGLNVKLNPGETKDIILDTSVAGSFSFRCGVPCGDGHKEMKGTIVIS